MDQKPNQISPRQSLLASNPKPIKSSLIQVTPLPSPEPKPPQPKRAKAKNTKSVKRKKKPIKWIVASVLAVGSLATATAFMFTPEDQADSANSNDSENAASADASSDFVPTEDALAEDPIALISEEPEQTVEPTPVKNEKPKQPEPLTKEKEEKPTEPKNEEPPAPNPEPSDKPDNTGKPTNNTPQKPKSDAPQWKGYVLYSPGQRVSYEGQEYEATSWSFNEQPNSSGSWRKVGEAS